MWEQSMLQTHLRSDKITSEDFYLLGVLRYKMNEIWNINKNESIFIPERLFVCVCVFDCEGHRRKSVQGLKNEEEREKKRSTACTQSGSWTMHSNPVQSGCWHIQSNTMANGFNFAKKMKKKKREREREREKERERERERERDRQHTGLDWQTM